MLISELAKTYITLKNDCAVFGDFETDLSSFELIGNPIISDEESNSGDKSLKCVNSQGVTVDLQYPDGHLIYVACFINVTDYTSGDARLRTYDYGTLNNIIYAFQSEVTDGFVLKSVLKTSANGGVRIRLLGSAPVMTCYYDTMIAIDLTETFKHGVPSTEDINSAIMKYKFFDRHDYSLATDNRITSITQDYKDLEKRFISLDKRNGNIYANGNETKNARYLYMSIDKGNTWNMIYDFGYGKAIKNMIVTKLGTLLLWVRRGSPYVDTVIMRSTDGGNTFEIVYNIDHTSGAVEQGFCEHPTLGIFWGEYVTEYVTDYIILIRSDDDGETWSIAKQWDYYWNSEGLDTGDHIRHIHAVEYDEYEDLIWIATGDLDSQCRLYYSHDGENFTLAGSGDQSWRFVSVAFDKHYVYLPTDSTAQGNKIWRMSRTTKEKDLTLGVMDNIAFFARVLENGIGIVVTQLHPTLAVSDYLSIYSFNTNSITKIGEIGPSMEGAVSANIGGLFNYQDILYTNLIQIQPTDNEVFTRFIVKGNRPIT